MVKGRGGQPAALVLNWTRVGAEIPYDMVNALRARGVALTVMSCERMMAGEGTRVYAGTAPGRAPFTLTVSERSAPVANANSYYGANVSLDGRYPPRGSTAQCDF